MRKRRQGAYITLSEAIKGSHLAGEGGHQEARKGALFLFLGRRDLRGEKPVYGRERDRKGGEGNA